MPPADQIVWMRVPTCHLPLATPVSDAKALTGRQKPMTKVAMLFARLESKDGHKGLGFSWRIEAPLDACDHEGHAALAATCPTQPRVEHFDWLEPLFNERLEVRRGRMQVPAPA